MSNAAHHNFGIDPAKPGTDNDGLGDRQKVFNKTNPLNPFDN